MQEATNVRRYNVTGDGRYLGSVMLNDSPDSSLTVASIIAIKPGADIEDGDWMNNTVQDICFFRNTEMDMDIVDAMFKRSGIDRNTCKDFHIRRGATHSNLR